jgi:hypothetical protein
MIIVRAEQGRSTTAALASVDIAQEFIVLGRKRPRHPCRHPERPRSPNNRPIIYFTRRLCKTHATQCVAKLSGASHVICMMRTILDQQIVVRVPALLRAQLEAAAEADSRPPGQFIRKLLADAAQQANEGRHVTAGQE